MMSAGFQLIGYTRAYNVKPQRGEVECMTNGSLSTAFVELSLVQNTGLVWSDQ